MLGDLYSFKGTGEETVGACTVIEQVVQPASGPPPHLHLHEEEAFNIRDGTFSFLFNGKEKLLETGGFMHVPKGVMHTFRNIGERPGKLLVIITPAGLENFFYAVGAPVTDLHTPPAFVPAVLDKIEKPAGEYNMEIAPPAT